MNEPLSARELVMLGVTAFNIMILLMFLFFSRKSPPPPVLSELGAKILAKMQAASVYDCVHKDGNGLLFNDYKLIVSQFENSFTDPVSGRTYYGKVFLESRRLDDALNAVDHVAILDQLLTKLAAVNAYRTKINADYALKKLSSTVSDEG